MSRAKTVRSELFTYVEEGGGVQAAVGEDLLHGEKISAPETIPVQISSQVTKIVEQLPEALGLSQLSIVSKSKAIEVKLDHLIEQRLDLVTLDNPAQEMLKVINTARTIARTRMDR